MAYECRSNTPVKLTVNSRTTYLATVYLVNKGHPDLYFKVTNGQESYNLKYRAKFQCSLSQWSE